MKIDLKWSKKQLKIIRGLYYVGFDPEHIICFHHENKVIIRIKDQCKKLYNKTFHKDIVAEPKNGDDFNLSIGIKVAKLKFLKRVIDFEKSDIIQMHNRTFKSLQQMKAEYQLISDEIKDILKSY